MLPCSYLEVTGVTKEVLSYIYYGTAMGWKEIRTVCLTRPLTLMRSVSSLWNISLALYNSSDYYFECSVLVYLENPIALDLIIVFFPGYLLSWLGRRVVNSNVMTLNQRS